MNVQGKAAFNAGVDSTLAECAAISNQRGGEYQDTWALENQVTTMLNHVLRVIGRTEFTPEQKRLILIAALCDVKDSRMIGEFKKDSHVDAINYRAALAAWLEEYVVNHPKADHG